MRVLIAILSLAFSAGALAAPRHAPVANNPGTTARIVDEGLNHSEVMTTAEYLFDRIGARLTGSPAAHSAEDWTQSRFRDWGLANVHKEAFPFGRGWSIDHVSVRMIAPRPLALRAIPIAWQPGTAGAVSGEIVVAPMRRVRDFDQWRGKLRGKIVLVTLPSDGSEPKDAPFERLTAEQLAKLDSYPLPDHERDLLTPKVRARIEFAPKLDRFLAAEGATAYLTQSYRDGGLLHGEGYQFETGGQTPGVQVGAEDYRRLARLARTGPVRVEIDSGVRFYEGERGYNVFAEIPGSDPSAGYVMAGGHLDSWVAGDGAADDGAGVVSVMEAARILARTGVHPHRTIRFVLWEGEEQGLIGSRTYVEQHFASRARLAGASALADYLTWADRYPVTKQADYDRLAAYFNIDNGSGKLRGVYAEGNLAAVPVLEKMIASFRGMGVTQVAIGKTGGTDHELMAAVGLPAFQFIQDPLDYESRVHHSSNDTYDHLKADDLRQASTVLAAILLEAADAPQPMPRAPFPSKPTLTRPFATPDPDDADDR